MVSRNNRVRVSRTVTCTYIAFPWSRPLTVFPWKQVEPAAVNHFSIRGASTAVGFLHPTSTVDSRARNASGNRIVLYYVRIGRLVRKVRAESLRTFPAVSLWQWDSGADVCLAPP